MEFPIPIPILNLPHNFEQWLRSRVSSQPNEKQDQDTKGPRKLNEKQGVQKQMKCIQSKTRKDSSSYPLPLTENLEDGIKLLLISTLYTYTTTKNLNYLKHIHAESLNQNESGNQNYIYHLLKFEQLGFIVFPTNGEEKKQKKPSKQAQIDHHLMFLSSF